MLELHDTSKNGMQTSGALPRAQAQLLPHPLSYRQVRLRVRVRVRVRMRVCFRVRVRMRVSVRLRLRLSVRVSLP